MARRIEALPRRLAPSPTGAAGAPGWHAPSARSGGPGSEGAFRSLRVLRRPVLEARDFRLGRGGGPPKRPAKTPASLRSPPRGIRSAPARERPEGALRIADHPTRNGSRAVLNIECTSPDVGAAEIEELRRRG